MEKATGLDARNFQSLIHPRLISLCFDESFQPSKWQRDLSLDHRLLFARQLEPIYAHRYTNVLGITNLGQCSTKRGGEIDIRRSAAKYFSVYCCRREVHPCVGAATCRKSLKADSIIAACDHGVCEGQNPGEFSGREVELGPNNLYDATKQIRGLFGPYQSAFQEIRIFLGPATSGKPK
jgi:hypothetical protein